MSEVLSQVAFEFKKDDYSASLSFKTVIHYRGDMNQIEMVESSLVVREQPACGCPVVDGAYLNT